MSNQLSLGELEARMLLARDALEFTSRISEDWDLDKQLRHYKEQVAMALRSLEGVSSEYIPVNAIRGIAVEAIRDATGCPDFKGKDGKFLVDNIEELARKVAKL